MLYDQTLLDNPDTVSNSVSSRSVAPNRVMYVDHTAKIGGGEIAILNLIRSIDHTRFQPVFVLATSGPLVDRLHAAGIETHILPLDPSINDVRKDSLGFSSLLRIREAVMILRYIIRLSALMRNLNVDLVHTNSLKAHIFGGVAARLAGKQVVWHVRDAIDDQYLPGIVAVTVRRLARVLPNYIVANSNSTLGKLQLQLTKKTAIVYSGIDSELPQLAGSSFVVHDACDPVSPNSSDSTSMVVRFNTPVVVTMVGRIAEWKGQHIFLKAAAKLLQKRSDIIFQIVGAPLFGEHDYETSLHELTNQLGIGEHVHFLGFREDVPQIVALCDILVHASITGEPFGQVVIEGMAAAKPVIATNGGALPEIVIDGVTGLLVEMGSVDAMASALEKVLASPAEAREMGLAGRQRVLEKFTLDRCAAEIHQVYEKMLQNTDGAAA